MSKIQSLKTCIWCDAIMSIKESASDPEGRCYFCRNFDSKEEMEAARYRISHEELRS